MSRGFFCPRGKALVFEQPFDPLRVRHPLKRVGERGEGKWVQLTWQQALDEIAEKIKKVIEAYGPESVSSSLDCGLTTKFASHRFMKKLGSPNWFYLGGAVCYANSALIETVTYGQDTVCDRPNSKCTVIWGHNPSVSKPEWFQHIRQSKEDGGKIIVVDPQRTHCVEVADIWLQIRPGSDGAMMLAWLNVIMNEGLYDAKFVEKWTNAPYLVRLDCQKILRESDLIAGGAYEKFFVWSPSKGIPVAFELDSLSYQGGTVKPPLTGTYEVTLSDGSTATCTTVWELLKKEVGPYTAERVSEITWVPAEKIKEAARMFATARPGNWFAGVALDAIGYNTNQCGRARNILGAIVGNLDVRGGQVMLGPHPKVNSDTGALSPEQAAKMVGADRF